MTPRTASTFEPLTFEDVMNIVEVERPDGVIVQFGGQTPLNLALPLARAGVPILGTSPDSIDRAEDRERFQQLIRQLGLTPTGQWHCHIPGRRHSHRPAHRLSRGAASLLCARRTGDGNCL